MGNIASSLLSRCSEGKPLKVRQSSPQNAQQDKDISLYINSPGGSISAGMAIHDTMQYIKCDVSTICMGMAASMGAFLLASGTKGKRFALPNSEILIHQPLIGGQGGGLFPQRCNRPL